MKTKKTLAILSLVALVTITSCKKYEDGPLLSLRSKKERVANDWRVAKALNGSEDVTGDFDQYEISLTKEGGAKLSAKYVFLGTTYEYVTEGTWSFLSNKEKISLDYENNDADAIYLILKLEEKEMWVREEGTNLELHLVPR